MRPESLRGYGPVGTNGPAESHDDVVAEMHRGGGTETGWIGIDTVRNWADRLQSAHARELAEQQSQLNHVHSLCNSYRDRIAELEAAYLHYRPLAERADAAMGLVPRLRVVVQYCPSAERTTLNTLLGELQQALAGGKKKE